MKRSEILIVVLLVCFGAVYQSVGKGCGVNISEISKIRSKRIAVRSLQKEVKFDAEFFKGIRKVILYNRAGDIALTRSESDKIEVNRSVRVYDKSKDDSKEIVKKIAFFVKSKGDVLEIRTEKSKKFPYRRARVFFGVSVPAGVDVEVSLAYGKLKIDGISSSAKIKVSRADVYVDNMKSIDLAAYYSDLKIMNIAEKLNIRKLKRCDLELEAVCDSEIYTLSSDIEASNVNGIFAVSGKSSDFVLKEMKGELNIDVKSGDIEMSGFQGTNIVIKNSYNDVVLKKISADNVNLFVNKGNTYVHFINIKEALTVNSRNGDVVAVFPEAVKPFFNIKLNHGVLENFTETKFNLVKDNYRQSFSSKAESGSPDVILSNTYGDITLKNYKFSDKEQGI